MSNESKQTETLSLQSDVEPNTISFTAGEFIEIPIVKICGDGDIFVKGQLVENDLELVNGLREFLNIANHQIDKTKTDSNQSSVEQLMWKLWDTPKDKFTWYTIMKHYNEIHKYEVMDAYTSGEHQQGFEGEAEQYYNETFE